MLALLYSLHNITQFITYKTSSLGIIPIKIEETWSLFKCLKRLSGIRLFLLQKLQALIQFKP